MGTRPLTKILFISRAYPPIVGGIENQNYELSVWLSKIADVTTIVNRKGKKALPWFLPITALRTLWIASRYDAIVLGDGVLGIIGFLCKKIHPNIPVIAVVHGLDLTYTSALYQKWWVRTFLPALDKLIAVGNETIRVGVERSIPENKFVFIPNGVNTDTYFHTHDRSELEQLLGQSLEGKKVILTLGRLAKRKGVAWFILNVFPHLSHDTLYIVAGDGVDKENIRNAIQETNLSSRIHTFGFVDHTTRNILLNTCDLFVQPNIRITGDMEGFGISVIEAASCQLPVVASRLEGLKDAIQDGESGFLVEAENADAYREKIQTLLADKDALVQFGIRARQYIIDHFHWSSVSKRYLDAIDATIKH